MLQVKFECRKVREQILPSSLNHYIHKDGCFVRGQGKGKFSFVRPQFAYETYP